jgi:hypothetical protein
MHHSVRLSVPKIPSVGTLPLGFRDDCQHGYKNEALCDRDVTGYASEALSVDEARRLDNHKATIVTQNIIRGK